MNKRIVSRVAVVVAALGALWVAAGAPIYQF